MSDKSSVEQALQRCKEKELKDSKDALPCLQEILGRVTDPYSRIVVLDELGHVQTRAALFSAARKTFLDLQTLSKGTSLDEGIVRALIGLAAVEARQGQAIEMTSLAREALQLSKAIAYARGEAQSNHYIAVGQWREGDSIDAERHIDRAIALWREIKDEFALAESLNVAAAIHETRGDREAARAMYDNAFQLFEAKGSTRQMAIVLNNKAIAEKRLGAYNEACRDFELGIYLAKEANDFNLTLTFMINYADVLRDRGDYNKSRSYLEEALQISQSAEDSIGTALALGDLAITAYQRGNVQRTLSFFRESLRAFESPEVDRGQLDKILLYSRALADFQLMSEARKTLEKAEKLASNNHSLAKSGLVDLAWGYYEKAEGNSGKAKQWLQKAYSAARRARDPDTVILVIILLIEIELERELNWQDTSSLNQVQRYIREGKEIAQVSGRFVHFVDLLLIESMLLFLQFKFDEALRSIREAANLSSQLALRQMERVRALEEMLRRKIELLESQKPLAILFPHSIRDLLDLIDSLVRRRFSDRFIDIDEIFLLVVAVDPSETSILFSDPLLEGKDPPHSSILLGRAVASVIGSSETESDDLYGPLAVPNLIDYETLVYPFLMPEKSQQSPQKNDFTYHFAFLMFPAYVRGLFWNHPALLGTFKEHLQISAVSEVTANRCIALKEALFKTLGY
ncbi:MAG: tetratricopeptide repeat protein [Candidatus Thorarchaeota archaeon]